MQKGISHLLKEGFTFDRELRLHGLALVGELDRVARRLTVRHLCQHAPARLLHARARYAQYGAPSRRGGGAEAHREGARAQCVCVCVCV